MTLRTFAVLFWGCLIVTAAVASEEQRTRIEVEVESDGADHKIIRFDSAASGVDLHDLKVGESKTVTDESGTEMTVLRTEDGFEFDVEGETIKIGGMDEGHEILMVRDGDVDFDVLHEGMDDENVFIKKHNKEVRIMKTRSPDGVTIISGSEINAEARAKVEAALKEAGVDGEVMFIDGSELDGDGQVHEKHEVRIIKKKTDATN